MPDIKPIEELNEHQKGIRDLIAEFHKRWDLGVQDIITEIAVQRAGRELEQATIKRLKESFLEMKDPYAKDEPFLKVALEYAAMRSIAKAKLTQADLNDIWIFFMVNVNMHDVKTPGAKGDKS